MTVATMLERVDERRLRARLARRGWRLRRSARRSRNVPGDVFFVDDPRWNLYVFGDPKTNIWVQNPVL
jgi:hypothetical protein